MKQKTQFAYFVCVGTAVVLVVFGWFWTTREAFVKDASFARRNLSDSVLSAKKEFKEAKQIKQNAQENLKQVETAADMISDFVEKKEAVSQSLIESLKQSIEKYEQEGTQKTKSE
jgi:hypothetical protein